MAMRDLGFTDDQELLYLTLIGRPHLRIVDLSDHLHRPLSQIEADIEVLRGFGLILADPDEDGRCVVKNPVSALGALIDRREDELMNTYRRVSETRAQVFAQISAIPSAEAPESSGDGVETIVGVDQVRAKLDELSFFARETILAVQPGGPQSVASLDDSQRLDQRALRRKLVMRVIHDAKIMDDEMNVIHLLELVRRGVQARVTSEPLSRMVIIDQKVAVIALDPADSRRGALLVRHPGLVLGFVQLFHRLWDNSVEIEWESSSSSGQESVDEQARQILALLAKGQTDEAVARTLGCSVRTVRRQVARLMVELKATSRFEAGMLAAQRGWLPTGGS